MPLLHPNILPGSAVLSTPFGCDRAASCRRLRTLGFRMFFAIRVIGKSKSEIVVHPDAPGPG
eukprot:6898183-Alexandrium_andersonii.AAC.1